MIKQILNYRFVFYFIVLSLFLYNCGAKDSYFQAKRSTRQTESTLRYMYKDVSKIKNALGMEDEKPSDEDAKKMKEGLATQEQQNMLRRYGYLYDFLNSKQIFIRQ